MDSLGVSFKPTTGRLSSISPVAIVISKKIIKSAVKRNKIKRRLRSVARELGLQGIIYVNKDISKNSYSTLLEALRKYKN